MTITTLSSRAFNQGASRAKQAAKEGPVFITDRGKRTHVLLSFKDYQRLTGNQMTLVQALAQHDVQDFDFEPSRVSGLYRPADLS